MYDGMEKSFWIKITQQNSILNIKGPADYFLIAYRFCKNCKTCWKDLNLKHMLLQSCLLSPLRFFLLRAWLWLWGKLNFQHSILKKKLNCQSSKVYRIILHAFFQEFWYLILLNCSSKHQKRGWIKSDKGRFICHVQSYIF